ncbi:Neutral alpha-glucosidase [Dirofilaria immitis]
MMASTEQNEQQNLLNYPLLSLDYTTSLKWNISFILAAAVAYLIFRLVLKKHFEEQMRSLYILFFNDDIIANGSARVNVEHLLHHYIHIYYPQHVITNYIKWMKPLDDSIKYNPNTYT